MHMSTVTKTKSIILVGNMKKRERAGPMENPDLGLDGQEARLKYIV